jgi:hypothetical protein
MCECASVECRGQVEVTPREWEAVAARRSEGEELVGLLHEYEIAQKPN